MSLLTPEQKAALSADLDAVVKTFLQPIVVYIGAERVIVSTNPDFTRFNDADQNEVAIENDPNRYVISGRIQYEKRQKYYFSNLAGGQDEEALRLRNPEGEVRIKVDASGASVLRNAKQIELDGTIFNLNSVQRPHGLFSGNYSTFHFQRVQ